MDTVCYIVGEVSTDEFTFVTYREIAPSRLEYLVVNVDSPAGTLEVLAQVVALSVQSRVLDRTLSYTEVESILNRLKASPPVIIGTAKVLGYLQGRTVRFPRHAATPGSPVERAPDELLRRFFSHSVESGINIGTLINRPEVSVMLDPNGLRRHLAVIAQTGAGKSYTVGVILEKLLQLGGTVVVFDPNSDYVLMRRDKDQRPTPFADRVDVYRLPTAQAGRIADKEIGGAKKFSMQFSKLDADELCQMTGIAPTSTNIRKAIQTVCDRLHGRDYSPKEFLEELDKLAQGFDGAPPPRELHPSIGDERTVDRDIARRVRDKAHIDNLWEEMDNHAEDETESSPAPVPASKTGNAQVPASLDAASGAQKALKYIERLERVDIWGYDDVPMDDLLRPMMLSVIDLAGVDAWISEFLVDKVLREAWGLAVNQGLNRPVFIVLEEAHHFVPGGSAGQATPSQAAGIIKRIAAEGRKFGLFLVLVTQRPYKVHGDTLSQCNSQIIMRLTNPQDQNAIRQSSESVSEGLLADLPGLNIGEAVVLGPIVRVPVQVRIGERLSKEGGNDINVVEKLAKARTEVITEQREAQVREERRARGRTEWEEAV